MLPAIDILLVGHVCRDATPQGPRLGGTVTFSGLTARALGRSVGIVTSAPDDMLPLLEPLHAVALHRIPAPQATAFVNHYTPEGRQQTLTGRAAPLAWEDIPAGWQHAPLVHIAPVADEIDPAVVAHLSGAFIGLTPQGWMRGWDAAGHVSFKGWNLPDDVLAAASAVVFSIEDVQGDEALAHRMASRCPVLVVTRGPEGCTLFERGQARHIPATPAAETDPTGAGDIFAMAFFVRLSATGDAAAAAHFASALAGRSVTRVGLAGIPTAAEIEAASNPA